MDYYLSIVTTQLIMKGGWVGACVRVCALHLRDLEKMNSKQRRRLYSKFIIVKKGCAYGQINK